MSLISNYYQFINYYVIFDRFDFSLDVEDGDDVRTIRRRRTSRRTTERNDTKVDTGAGAENRSKLTRERLLNCSLSFFTQKCFC